MLVYLVFLLVFFVPPVLVIGWLLRRRWKYVKRTVLWSLLFVYTVGFLWDWLAVQTGVWRYDSAETLGVWVGGLPVEEFVGFYVFGTLLLVGVPLLLCEGSDHV